MAILLDAGADPIIFNENYMTPILEAAKNGFFPYVYQNLLYV